MSALPDFVPLRKAGRFPCLVLNADYRPLSLFPISIWDRDRAAHAVVLDRVDVVAEHDSPLRSQRLNLKRPSVVALREYVPNRKDPVFSRHNVLLRDRFCCAYCAVKFPVHRLTIDHVIPLSRGGANDWFNVVCSCDRHNWGKGNRTPQEAGLQLQWRGWKPSQEDLHQATRRIPLEQMHNGWAMFLDWDDPITA